MTTRNYRDPTTDERIGEAEAVARLIGAHVTIYWDGDKIYFPGKSSVFVAENV